MDIQLYHLLKRLSFLPLNCHCAWVQELGGVSVSDVGEMDGSAQAEREQIHLSSAFLFYLGPESIGWWPPHAHWGGPSTLLSSLNQMLISSGKLLQTHLEIFSLAIWSYLIPVKLAQKINQDTVFSSGASIFRLLTHFAKTPSFQTSEMVCGKAREMLFFCFLPSKESQTAFSCATTFYKEFHKQLSLFLCST